MKIIKGEMYKIKRFEESKSTTGTYLKNPVDDLNFSGEDLFNAIISAGMPDVYLGEREERNRKDEINFKIQLFELFVNVNEHKELVFNRDVKKYLDSSEVGVINYWLAMFLTTLLGKKKYEYEFMVHLSKYKLFSNTISIITKESLSPDLIAVSNSSSSADYGVFEAKGRRKYDKGGMEKACAQAKSIDTINGKKPKDQLAVMTITYTDPRVKEKEFEIIQRDPEGGNVKLNINLALLYLYHYIPIAELIAELEPKEINGRVVGIFKYNNAVFKISLPKEIYDMLSIDPGQLFTTYLESDKENSEYIDDVNNNKIINIFKNYKNILIVE